MATQQARRNLRRRRNLKQRGVARCHPPASDYQRALQDIDAWQARRERMHRPWRLVMRFGVLMLLALGFVLIGKDLMWIVTGAE